MAYIRSILSYQRICEAGERLGGQRFQRRSLAGLNEITMRNGSTPNVFGWKKPVEGRQSRYQIRQNH